jgi:hypothetical protein
MEGFYLKLIEEKDKASLFSAQAAEAQRNQILMLQNKIFNSYRILDEPLLKAKSNQFGEQTESKAASTLAALTGESYNNFRV